MAAPAGLTIKTKVEDMQIGDCIPCRYKATSGVAGVFSELGTCTAAEIPVTGLAVPDGLFYFIKADKGILIADRIVQHSVSWDTLNTAKYIQGKLMFTTLVPTLTSISDQVLCGSQSGYAGWRAFDGILQDYGWNSASNVTASYLGFNFGIPTLVTNYTLYCAGDLSDYIAAMPKNWTFEGSNDGTNWIVLDTRVNVTFISREFKTFYMNNQQLYNMYRINVSAVNGYSCIMIDTMYMDNHNRKPYIIRSLTGGVIYLSATGTSSTTDAGLGAWPPNNEWDKYIVKSTLGDKISASDDNVWHWYTAQTLAQETLYSDYRIIRGTAGGGLAANRISAQSSNVAYDNMGFRPVLEYLESNTKATTLWY